MQDLLNKVRNNMTASEVARFNLRYSEESKSEVIAYIWWAFLGPLGGHRFYLRHYGTGIILMVITLFTLGLGSIAGWYDVVNIKRLTEEENKETVLQLVKEVKRK